VGAFEGILLGISLGGSEMVGEVVLGDEVVGVSDGAGLGAGEVVGLADGDDVGV